VQWPDYPFEGRTFDRAGLRLHYLDEGAGESVVMVHGNPTWSYYYRHLVLALRGTHRCLVPDHIGCGLSDKPTLERYGYTLRERVDDFAAWMDAVNLSEKITLIVHDWGGMIGMSWAVRHPERIARIVVLNTAAFSLPPTKSLPWALKLGRDSQFGRYLISRHNLFARAATWVGSMKGMTTAEKQAYLAPYDTPEHRIATWRFVQTIPLSATDEGYDIVQGIESGLAGLAHLPMWIGWGMRDFVFDRHFLAGWRQRFPHAFVQEYPHAGHYVLEDARTSIIEGVRSFLAT